MKFKIGGLDFKVDIDQLFQGHGITLHINGEIRPDLKLAVELIYLPISIEKLSVSIRVNEQEVISGA